jgi:rubrerythrin
MALNLTVADLFDMARQVEEDARAFYLSAANAVASDGVRQLLLSLAEMESEHAAVFGAMGSSLAGRADGFVPKSLAVTQVLCSGVRQHLVDRFTGQESEEEVLHKAVEFERDTIAFLVGAKSAVPEEPERRKIDALIREELGHIMKLAGLQAGKERPPPLSSGDAFDYLQQS